MNFAILVNAPPFGSQGAFSAYQFCKAAVAKGHQISQIFFYQAGINNANDLLSPPSDELNLRELWQALAQTAKIQLNVCVAAAQRRGVIDQPEANAQQKSPNLAKHFTITGLGQLVEAANKADRFITFN